MESKVVKVVARFMDGRLLKGYTFDFTPSDPRFHVFATRGASGVSALVLVRDLKALFFVRDFAGDPAHRDSTRFDAAAQGGARRVEVRFLDGELMVGTVEAEASDRSGFFLVPADPRSNNLRVYVVVAATRSVHPLPSPGSVSRTPPPGTEPGRGRAPAPALPRRLLAWLAS